jgi:hypothetical protein
MRMHKHVVPVPSSDDKHIFFNTVLESNTFMLKLTGILSV